MATYLVGSIYLSQDGKEFYKVVGHTEKRVRIVRLTSKREFHPSHKPFLVKPKETHLYVKGCKVDLYVEG